VIVRILGGEGQFQVGDEATAKLTALDKKLDSTIEASDEAAFKAALAEAVRLVRESGTTVPDEEFVTADYILPFPDASLAEVRQLLADGKIPGDSVGFP
jgi:hypothetical protein